MSINFDSGGAEVIDRILKAYGFKTKLALANHLEISGASLSIRYKRNNFPSDIVVRCMDETGATLKWLATGEGEFSPNEPNQKEAVLSNETLAKLERLSVLKKDGIISEEKLNELKAKLI